MQPVGDQELVAELGWSELTERSWEQFAGQGLPQQLIDLTGDLGQRNERRIRAYTMPMLEVGVAGLALPFVHDDGIAVDPYLLGHPRFLARVVGYELAHLLYPGWGEQGVTGHDAVEEFASTVAPTILRRLPRTVGEIQPVVELTALAIRAA
jgi:hypothetical protein